MASGLSFPCGVALNEHLNPCPHTAVPNLAGMELVPQSGAHARARLYVVPSHPTLGCCLTCSPAAFPSLWRSRALHVTPGSVGRSHQVPAAGQGRCSPP